MSLVVIDDYWLEMDLKRDLRTTDFKDEVSDIWKIIFHIWILNGICWFETGHMDDIWILNGICWERCLLSH